MDERIKAYDVKMTKSYNNLLEEFGAIRAGRANPARTGSYHRRVLRNTDATSAGRKRYRSGAAYDPDPAVGCISDQRDLQSDPDIRPWHQSEYRRKSESVWYSRN